MVNDAPKIELQSRDLDILVGLFECRVMSLQHVTALVFGGKGEAAKKRVQKLKASGYIRERSRSVGDHSLLHLTKKGFAALRENNRLDSFPASTEVSFEKRSQVSELTLRHELEVMDVRVAICTALANSPNHSITEFSTWPLLYQFKARHDSPILGRRELVMKPDGFIRIREVSNDGAFEHLFFVEVDRSTETQEILAQKAACYLDYYQSGGMALRFGGRREEFKEFPFRVLMVFKNDERRNNAAERLLKNNPPILSQVWLSTLAEVSDTPLGKIWIRPKDYLEHMRDVIPNFDTLGGVGYRRQIERERCVNTRVPKLELFQEPRV